MRYFIFSLLAFSCSIFGQEPSFENPVSQMATESQFHSPDFVRFAEEMGDAVTFHRKQWELCYICQVLSKYGYLQPGKIGLGFGVGKEPLPSLFANYGCELLATDQNQQAAFDSNWAQSSQWASSLEDLNIRKLCPDEDFYRLVNYRSVDMNAIDPDLTGFDFVWSACALEHLGSIQAGFEFIKNSLKCLNPGGVAVHTTEFNISSNNRTLTKGPTVLYRKRDIERFVEELSRLGYRVLPVNFSEGDQPLDRYTDLPPYCHDKHIKLKIDKYKCTSIGLVIFKD